jgi:hypothetical protein
MNLKGSLPSPAQANLTWLYHVSTVVEYLTHNPLAQGSNPAREKVVGKRLPLTLHQI